MKKYQRKESNEFDSSFHLIEDDIQYDLRQIVLEGISEMKIDKDFYLGEFKLIFIWQK